MRFIWLALLILLTTLPAFATESVDDTEADAPAKTEIIPREPQDIQEKFTGEPAGVFRLIGTEIKPGTSLEKN